MEALKCHTTSEFGIKHVQKREDIQLKKFLHHLLFSLKCYLGFSGSIVGCIPASIMVGKGEKIKQQIKCEKRREHEINHVPKKANKKRLKKSGNGSII